MDTDGDPVTPPVTTAFTVTNAAILFEYLDIYVRGSVVAGEYFGFESNSATSPNLVVGESVDTIFPTGTYNAWFARNFFAPDPTTGTDASPAAALTSGSACVDVYKRDATATDTLMAYFSFDTSSVLDTSGHARHGTLIGSVPLIADGVSGQAATFDGSQAGSQIISTRFREQQWGSVFSASFWFRRTGGAGSMSLLTSGNCWNVRMSSTSMVEAGVNTLASPTTSELQQATTMYSWQHVALVYNGHRGDTSLFVNGVKSSSSADSGSTGSCVDPLAPLVIGAGYSEDSQPYIGDIDELRIYMTALSVCCHHTGRGKIRSRTLFQYTRYACC